MKDIKGYEGLYAITSCGKVWSYRTKKFLKLQKTHNGYYFVKLSHNGERTYPRVHRLVAEAYLPNDDNLPQVNHKDEIKTHNWINNLEWCTAKDNCNYGERNTKISKKVLCVETGEIFNSTQEAADWAGLKVSSLYSYFNRKNKTAGGYHWQRV